MGSVGRGKFGVKNIYNMIKQIDIGGIERQLSVSNMADGSMYELRGMTHRGGNLRPQGGFVPSSIVNIEEGSRLLYVHRYEGYEHFITLSEDSVLYYQEDHDRPVEIGEVGDVKEVTSIGNMLIAVGCNVQAVPNVRSVRTWVWKNGVYVEWSVGEMPTMIFERMPNSYNGTSDSLGVQNLFRLPVSSFPSNGYAVQGVDGSNAIDVQRELAELYKAGQGQLREEAYHNNSFIDSMLVRYGVRMYDGSYAYVSPPVLLPAAGGYAMNATVTADSTYSVKSAKTNVTAKGYSVGYRLSVDSVLKGLDAELTPYIDIFVSESIDPTSSAAYIERIKSAHNAGGSGYDYKSDLFLEFEVPQKLINIEDSYVYYRVDSIKVEEAQKKDDNIDAVLQVGEKMSYLRQLPILENVRGMSYYDGECSYVYNSRLHLGGITEYLMHNISSNLYTYAEADEGDDGYYSDNESVVIVYYDIDGNERYVGRVVNNVLRGSNASRLISVPDGRAKRIVMARKINGSYTKIDLPLRTHAMDNMSYYYSNIGVSWSTISSTEYDKLKGTAYNGVVERRQVLKVSELYNPMVFENAKTYTVGNGKIVAMASATKAMSTGQFGQYPLYVFASDGIYAMLSGGGDVVYSHVSPVNHHIVENARTVCPVDEAVVFGTRQGLFVLAGGDAVNISTPLDEHGLPIIENGRNLENLVQNVCGENINGLMLRERIAEGGVAYHYANREILLYDKSGDCKIYSIDKKMWYSSAYDVRYAVASCPELYVVDGTNVYTIKDVPSGGATSSMLLVTNPMQLSDAMGAKRAARIHLVSHLCGASDKSHVDVGIGVSNDGEEYALAYKKSLRVGKVHNLTIPHGMSGYRYMVIVVFGYGMDARSYINSIEVEFDEVRKER